MNNIIIDCKIYNSKIKLLTHLQQIIEEMYSPNYDALIDALTMYQEPTTINIFNSSYFENEIDLKEIFTIINNENTYITVIYN